jgi:hypothetical protein
MTIDVNVFLSASVPLPTRDKRFHSTADVLAIKEAIKALIVEIIPRGRIVFGGHPAITPLISALMKDHYPEKLKQAVLYQSLEFDEQFPQEVLDFLEVIFTPKSTDGRDSSLLEMRRRMIQDSRIDAAIFIGGMDGVIEEYKLVKELAPNAKILPIASTGAAALEIFNSGTFPEQLEADINYSSVFRTMI